MKLLQRAGEHISNLPSQLCIDDDEFLDNLLSSYRQKENKRFLIEAYDSL